MSTTRPFLPLLPILLLLITLGGCNQTTSEPAQSIEGRWQRLSPTGPGDVSELSSDYLEFRDDSDLLALLNDNGRFWLISSATYTVTAASQIEVTGTCWRS